MDTFDSLSDFTLSSNLASVASKVGKITLKSYYTPYLDHGWVTLTWDFLDRYGKRRSGFNRFDADEFVNACREYDSLLELYR